jgi:hypothetical protein
MPIPGISDSVVRSCRPLRLKESGVIGLLQVYGRRFDVDLRYGV